MKININDYVTVVLTEYGASVYKDWASQFKYHKPPPKDAGEVYRDSLWSVMQIFGSSIHLGGEVPFQYCEMIIGEEK